MLWRDGHVGEGTTAPLDHADRGLTLGDGLFDTALALGGRIAFEAAHIDRLVAAAETLGIPVEAEAIRTAMRALAGRGPRLAIRTTLTRGAGPRGLKPPDAPHPTLFATAAPSGRALAFAPLRLWPTAIARNDTSPTARLKTLGYLDAVLAARDAAAAGFDEAMFLNTRGMVACAGTGNLVYVMPPSSLGAARDDAEGRLTLVTPPLTDGVLAGIVRAQVLALAPACGLAVEERSLTRDDLRAAKAVFLTNSLRLLAPVTAVGEVAYDSAGHPAFPRLRDALRGAVAESCGVPPEEVA
ncbi:aminotransferase class IV [Methylobacterium persicinum]|uniref:Probable branched-chain-amino-acid aminotransferase n=1 Tax=Methylobacterium persicinum TaxID=374426 RepID=A0ABU0HNK9_9HYPH|nr:aminotransferase class IV [Methylobacterium persicinum]MDQ0443084.1 branched-chain amino acid aminotransferase [Methylobacterium persicinum]GJE38999.1 Aminodeoxychorismate lyase [Methylobacterium persicinum]